MKKSIPKVRERESEASILGNDREREFPLTPADRLFYQGDTEICENLHFFIKRSAPENFQGENFSKGVPTETLRTHGSEYVY